MSWSPCAEFGNRGAIPASCLSGPFWCLVFAVCLESAAQLAEAAEVNGACRFYRRLETSAGVIAYRHRYSTPDIIFRPPYYAHLKLRGLAMPLTATFDPGHNHYPNENVYFFMNDRDRRVSELALEVFDPQFERSKEGRLLAFNKYRPHIESVASAKYDRGQMERDGRSVLVSVADIQGTFRPSNH
jgi:hypothetical protein